VFWNWYGLVPDVMVIVDDFNPLMWMRPTFALGPAIRADLLLSVSARRGKGPVRLIGASMSAARANPTPGSDSGVRGASSSSVGVVCCPFGRRRQSSKEAPAAA
jgi:hypothetical protein